MGPTVRAGLMEADVAGATTMIAANTANPMASPAQPAGARRSITPNTVNTRRNVPMNSAKVACP
jgi:hypothetical protein